MYEFDSSSAVCLGCSGNVGGENMILEHLVLKRNSEFGYLKTILKQADDNILKNMISKAVKSEFLFAEKKIYPVKVEDWLNYSSHGFVGVSECYCHWFVEIKLDLESIMSSPRIDFEKEEISIRINWDFKILN